VTTGLSPLIILLVLVAAALHASWNAILKVSDDRITTAALMNLTGLAIGLAVLPFVGTPAQTSWPFLLLSTAIHFGYYLFLLGSYRFGDLSQVYPLARGVAPLIVALLSPWLVGEVLAGRQLAGVLVLCLGILSLAFNRLSLRVLFDWKPVGFALATGACIAGYTLADGIGVRRSDSPGGYIVWLFILDGVAMAAIAAHLRRRDIAAAIKTSWRRAILAGILGMLAYAIVIWCYSLGAIAPIAALRETSVVIAAIIGAVLLREQFGRWRILAAACCSIGILAINLPAG